MARSWFAALLSLSLLGAACAPESPVVDDLERSSDDADALSLPVVEIGVTKSDAAAGITILRKKSDYVAFFGVQPPADLSFNKSWVVHYSMGVMPSGGYAAGVASIDRIGAGQGARLEIHTMDRSPGPNCIVTMALTNPQITVKIPKQKSNIIVEHHPDEVVTDCGTEPNWCAAALCGPGTVCDEFQDACVPIEQDFCPLVKCANGYECDEALDACVGRLCDPADGASCPSGMVCQNQIACITTPCPEEFRCEPAPEVTCDDIGWVGTCQGTTLKYCVGDDMTTVDCAPDACGWLPAYAYYDCVP